MTHLFRSESGAARVRALYQELLDAWPVAHRQIRVATREGETFVLTCGRDDGPPLVLLHGSGGNSAMWSEDVERWSAAYRIYAVDLIGDPGFSSSSRPKLASGAYANWLGEVCSALGLGRVTLVGMSLGGWLALDFSIRNPGSVARLVLLSPGGVGRQRPSFLLRMIPLLLLGGWGRRRALQITSASAANPSAHQVRYLRFLSVVQQEFRRRMDPLPLFSDAELRQLKMPVLAIVGGADVILDSVRTRARLLANLIDVRVLQVPAAGHAIAGQSEVILAFLGEQRSTAP